MTFLCIEHGRYKSVVRLPEVVTYPAVIDAAHEAWARIMDNEEHAAYTPSLTESELLDQDGSITF